MSTRGNPYFVDPRKGEVNELRSLLTNANLMRNANKKRDVIKKVIGYMTLGIDVSSLFPNMVMLASTNDMIIKKMVYMYLTKYALENSELALLCVNTLCKDCEDMDPKIRGLALRSLSSLRLASLVEYIIGPLTAGLRDKDGYVRKTAVVGVMKMYHVVPETVEESGMIDTVKNMLGDRDPHVVSNAIVCLSEIQRTSGGITITRGLCVRLLKKIKQFNDWSQCIVLDFLWHYSPGSNKECFHIMNALDSCLQISHSGVVLAAAKIFLKYTKILGGSFASKIYQRLKTPFLTLLANPSPESDFVVLTHIKALCTQQPGMFRENYKMFFLRYNETKCIQHIKLEILAQLVGPKNALSIVDELSEWVMDIDMELGRRAVRAIGQIGVKAAPHIGTIVKKLLSFCDVSSEICSEVVQCLKDLLRKYPHLAQQVVPETTTKFKLIDDAAGKAAVIWLLGEFGELVEEGPYILEPLCAGYNEEPERHVRLELLTAAVKLFLKRAPECQPMLGTLFTKALGEGDAAGELDTDVHDRALMFYRLLQENVHKAKEIILCEKAKIGSFVSGEGGLGKRVFEEFNSLSVVYNQPEDLFTDDNYKWVVVQAEAAPRGGASPSVGSPVSPAPAPAASANLLGDFFGGGSPAPAPAPAPSTGGGAGALDDFFGGGGGSAPAPAPASIQLDPNQKLDQPSFQAGWKSNPVTGKIAVAVGAQNVPKIKAALANAGVLALALKDMGKAYKLFMYATEVAPASGKHLLMVMVEKATGRFMAQVKTVGGSYPLFEAKVKAVLSGL